MTAGAAAPSSSVNSISPSSSSIENLPTIIVPLPSASSASTPTAGPPVALDAFPPPPAESESQSPPAAAASPLALRARTNATGMNAATAATANRMHPNKIFPAIALVAPFLLAATSSAICAVTCTPPASCSISHRSPVQPSLHTHPG